MITIGVNNLLDFIKYVLMYSSFERQEILTDEQVVDYILNGNNQNYYFDILVERYYKKIFRYVYHNFGFSKDLSEEVLNEVFFKLWKKLDRFKEGNKFENWFYRITYNYCIDWIRKNKNSQYEQESGIEYDVKGEDDKNDLEEKYRKELILKLLNGLDEKYKNVIILFYFEEKTYEEIAYILDINSSSVGTLLNRAKAKLKDKICDNPELYEALEFDL